jgi:hypothetical protein
MVRALTLNACNKAHSGLSAVDGHVSLSLESSTVSSNYFLQLACMQSALFPAPVLTDANREAVKWQGSGKSCSILCARSLHAQSCSANGTLSTRGAFDVSFAKPSGVYRV